MYLWLAKDKCGRVNAFLNKPTRIECRYNNSWMDFQHPQKNKIHIPSFLWKELGCEDLKWEDEPMKFKMEKEGD